MRDFRKIATRGGNANGEGFGLYFMPPFDAPRPAARVTDADAWLRAGEMLLDEPERWDRDALGAAGPEAQISRSRQRRLAPDPMPDCDQTTRAGPPDPPLAAEMPDQIDGP